LAVTGIATAETLQVGDQGLNVTGVSTFASTVNLSSDLDVDGRTELDDVNVSEGLSVTGVGTFLSSVNVGSAVTINSTGVNVTGVTTADTLIINNDFDVFDVQAVFHNNVLINGTLSIGGTTTVVAAQDLIVANKDIVLGYTTNITNDDVSNDDTANHGGIAVASTEGTPLVPFKVTGINTFPDTYKQIMWVKSGTYSGLGTDAWMFNYGVGIGSTQVPNGVRLAVSQIQMTDNSVNAANFVGTNVNASGITSTNSLNIGATQVISSGRQLQNIASLDATTTATIESAIANAPNTFTDLKVTGITTLGIASATDFTADNVNVSLATTTNILAVTGIATAETLQVGDQGLSVAGVTTTLTLEVGVVGNTLVGITTILDEDNLGSNSDTALATQQSIKAYVDSAIAGTANTDNVSTSTLVVAGVSTFNGDVNFAGATGVTSAFFDKSDNSLKFSDNVKGKFGDGGDLEIYHDGSNSYVKENGTGNLKLLGNNLVLKNSADGETYVECANNGAVSLYYDNSKKFETDNHGVKVTGIMTATDGYNIGIHSAGTEVTTATGIITALDFVGSGNSICFKNQSATSKVIEINIAGSGGGGGGGVTEVDTDVSSTSATGVGSFAVATYRSAAVIAQIDQTGDYQVGRYLMIHDGTTVTVVEESAVSTGATMLGSFSGAIVVRCLIFALVFPLTFRSGIVLLALAQRLVQQLIVN
jgi:hypothetical protein